MVPQTWIQNINIPLGFAESAACTRAALTPAIRTACMQAHAALERAARTVLGALCRGLGLGGGALSDFLDERPIPPSQLRCPSRSSAPNGGACAIVRCVLQHPKPIGGAGAFQNATFAECHAPFSLLRPLLSCTREMLYNAVTFVASLESLGAGALGLSWWHWWQSPGAHPPSFLIYASGRNFTLFT